MKQYKAVQEFSGYNWTDENTQIGLQDMLRYDNARVVSDRLVGDRFKIVVEQSLPYPNKEFTFDRWMSFGFKPTQDYCCVDCEQYSD